MYTVPVYMVVAHKMVDMLVVNMMVYSNGMVAGLLEGIVGMTG